MEHFGREAFSPQDEVPPPGSNSNESSLALFGYNSNWPINFHSATFLQYAAAPQSYCRQDGSDYVFPLCEPGSMNCFDPGIIPAETTNGPTCEDVWCRNHLDNLQSTDSNARNTTDNKSNFRLRPSGQSSIEKRRRLSIRPYHPQLSGVSISQQGQRFMSKDSTHLRAHGMLEVPSFQQTHISQRTRILREPISPVAAEKRTHDELVLANLETNYQPPRSPKAARLESERTRRDTIHSDYSEDPLEPAERFDTQMTSHSPYGKSITSNMTQIQKNFIRQWYETFAKEHSRSFPPNESINALATLSQCSPQSVQAYIERRYYMPESNPSVEGFVTPLSPTHLRYGQGRSAHSTHYSLRNANRHLPAQTLDLVDKYVSACQRRRAQSDGRRGVNEGPFRCTFGCSYQTKRAFDWRRHEETHEPQELWLCHLCCQNGEQNPFLVNRKDKFLKHAKDAHKEWEAETVLDMSKVDFLANFNPQCPLCPERCASWDDRCRHILTHYEDDIQRGMHPSSVRSRSEREGSVSDGSGRGPHRHSHSSDISEEIASPRSGFRKEAAQ